MYIMFLGIRLYPDMGVNPRRQAEKIQSEMVVKFGNFPQDRSKWSKLYQHTAMIYFWRDIQWVLLTVSGVTLANKG